MLKLSNAPEIEIEWGSQTPENRKKWIDWVFKNLNSIATNKNIKSDELKSFAQKLFGRSRFFDGKINGKRIFVDGLPLSLL